MITIVSNPADAALANRIREDLTPRHARTHNRRSSENVDCPVASGESLMNRRLLIIALGVFAIGLGNAGSAWAIPPFSKEWADLPQVATPRHDDGLNKTIQFADSFALQTSSNRGCIARRDSPQLQYRLQGLIRHFAHFPRSIYIRRLDPLHAG